MEFVAWGCPVPARRARKSSGRARVFRQRPVTPGNVSLCAWRARSACLVQPSQNHHGLSSRCRSCRRHRRRRCLFSLLMLPLELLRTCGQGVHLASVLLCLGSQSYIELLFEPLHLSCHHLPLAFCLCLVLVGPLANAGHRAMCSPCSSSSFAVFYLRSTSRGGCALCACSSPSQHRCYPRISMIRFWQICRWRRPVLSALRRIMSSSWRSNGVVGRPPRPPCSGSGCNAGWCGCGRAWRTGSAVRPSDCPVGSLVLCHLRLSSRRNRCDPKVQGTVGGCKNRHGVNLHRRRFEVGTPVKTSSR